jgi:hypothetical protein
MRISKFPFIGYGHFWMMKGLLLWMNQENEELAAAFSFSDFSPCWRLAECRRKWEMMAMPF